MEQPEVEAAADTPASAATEDEQKHVGVESSDKPDSQTGSSDHPKHTATETTAVEEEEEPEIVVDPAVVEKLTTGLLGLFLPNLQKAKGSLNEVLHNQEVLIETVTQENAKFTESSAMKDLTNTMKEARVYHAKLLTLKKEMNNLMDKSTKMKKRAVKLQQQKHKEVLDRAVQRDRELDREKLLTAKVARPQDNKDKDPSS